MSRTVDYALGRGRGETNRLIEQSRIYGPATLRLCADAGISEGMRVLDIGSGAGDVALTAARLVGESGRVVGVDMDGEILKTARARAEQTGAANVEFVAGNALALPLSERFDAVVGRFALMYMPDRQEALRRFAAHLKPGGIAAFQAAEYTLYPGLADPRAPLMRRLIEWIVSAFRLTGAHLDTGLALPRLFEGAGFAAPNMRLEAPVGAAESWGGYRYMETIFRSLLPRLERYGIASAEEAAVDTLARRLREEVLKAKVPFFLPPHVLAHARLKESR